MSGRHLAALATGLAIAWSAIAAGMPRSAGAGYEALIIEESRRGALDREPLAARVKGIFARLVAAIAAPPGRFEWEIHVTEDPEVAAFCMGRGKILVGARFVERLQLDDAGIAMLVAHEMAHAVAGHRRAMPRPAEGEGDPTGELRRNAIAVSQEEEADRIGFEIARRAGWGEDALLGFYERLAADVPAGQLGTSHASARERLARMREGKKPGSVERLPGQ